jgi:hypothetical protein
MAMASGGIQDSSLGIEYQLDLLLLCAHQSAESGIAFELRSLIYCGGAFGACVF